MKKIFEKISLIGAFLIALIFIGSAQIPTILPVSPVTENIIFEKNVTINGTLTASISALTGTLAVANGGTGASTFALNGVLYGNAANAIGITAIGAEGQVLRVGANPYVPAWSTLTLPNTGTAYRLPVFSATNVMTELAAVGATGEYLAGATGAIPAWATLNQAAVAGLTTADGPSWDHLHITGGTSALFSTYKGANSDGNNIFIGGGGQSSVGAVGETYKGGQNTFIGINAGISNTTGYDNTFSGMNAGLINTTGYYNTFSGMYAGYSNTTGYYNTFSGVNAGRFNTTGYYNTFSGVNAGYSNTTGSNNGVLGYAALYDLNITAGDGSGANTAVGYNTGRGIVTGVNNTILGAGVTGLASALSNNIILANGAGTINAQHDNTNWTLTGNIYPGADNTYYLGKNDDDTPLAYKGVILKDTTDGKYYRIEVISGVVTATDLTD